MSKSELGDVLVYLCRNYPEDKLDDLSNARLTKLVYLGDWQSARHSGSQITDINWVLNHYGPWVPDVIDTVMSDKRLMVLNESNLYGSEKTTIRLGRGIADAPAVELPANVRVILDSVIADTHGLYFGQFVERVYETYPVRHVHRFGILDLERFACDEAREDDDPIAPVVDFKSVGLSAVRYASLRDEVSRIVARSLLGRSIQEVVKLSPNFASLNGDLEESVLRGYFMAPEMAVSRLSEGGWMCSVTGRIVISGVLPKEVLMSGISPYQVVDADWDDRAILAEVGCLFASEVSVDSDVRGWIGELKTITIERDTDSTDVRSINGGSSEPQ